MKEALFYERLKDKVQCQLCPHNCIIADGKRGICGVRENKDGKLYSLVYGKAIANSLDPIEKKPLFHFLPGSLSYSLATQGCNLKCKFCQNWEISQETQNIIGKDISPEEIVQDAIDNDCKSISYTYTEPTIFFEYALDTAKIAHKNGLKNVFVSNGFINKEPIKEISRYLDAINIDLKGFSEDYYKKLCGARLKPVLDAIKEYHKQGVFLEITTLIVPGHNDNEDMLKKIAEFIASVDKNIPWHISRFFPHYKMDHTNPTDTSTIHKAIKTGKQLGIKYIYAGNIPGDGNESTYCPNCGKKIIERIGFNIGSIKLKGNKCPFCNSEINIIN